jgi:hypothetical protein
VRDRRNARCTPAMPDSLDVLEPAPSDDRASPAFQNRATLLAAFRASADPALPGARCSALNDIRVPVGAATLRIESTVGTRTDRDALALECLPARGTRRLPRLVAQDAAPRGHRPAAGLPAAHAHGHVHGAHVD